MGLSGNKTRRKLQEDPNNTKWSRNETSFGQRILRRQGWEPGQFLGSQDEGRSDFNTSASSAPIKVLLKDDTLGLGAKVRQKQGDECTGLDVFKDLLGRLNGKSEEAIETEKAIRSELKTTLYVERKYGPMRFVRGGLLVGDQINELLRKGTAEPLSEDVHNSEDKDFVAKAKKEKRSKKRRAHDDDAEDIDSVRERKRKKKGGSNLPTLTDLSGESMEAFPVQREKKAKKVKKEKKGDPVVLDGVGEVDEVREKSSSKKSRKEKKERRTKEEKKEKKSKKTKDVELSLETSAAGITSTTPLANGNSTPTESGTSTPQTLSGRHLSRSRYIASKRMAMADVAALNQIFMVKPV